jgi:hypothetical protein
VGDLLLIDPAVATIEKIYLGQFTAINLTDIPDGSLLDIGRVSFRCLLVASVNKTTLAAIFSSSKIFLSEKI